MPIDADKLYEAYEKLKEENNTVRMKDVKGILEKIDKSAVPSEEKFNEIFQEIPICYALLDDIANGSEIKEKYSRKRENVWCLHFLNGKTQFF